MKTSNTLNLGLEVGEFGKAASFPKTNLTKLAIDFTPDVSVIPRDCTDSESFDESKLLLSEEDSSYGEGSEAVVTVSSKERISETKEIIINTQKETASSCRKVGERKLSSYFDKSPKPSNENQLSNIAPQSQPIPTQANDAPVPPIEKLSKCGICLKPVENDPKIALK